MSTNLIKRHIKIFIAYSSTDVQLLEGFRKQLLPFEQRENLDICYDGEFIADKIWDNATQNAVNSADILIILLSTDSLVLNSFYEKEINKALERHKKEEIKVIPVILRACPWRFTEFANLQVLPSDTKPLVSWTNTDEAYTDVVEGILKITKEYELSIHKTEKQQASSVIINNPTNVWKYKKLILSLFLLIVLIIGIFELIKWMQVKDMPSFKMVSIPAGTFVMGCTSELFDCRDYELPTHRVKLSGFDISETEVTQAQWRTVMNTNPSYFSDCDDCPVENVSWNDIQVFLSKLNAKSDKKYRLPTEAEWEYAARSKQNYKYAGSDNIDDIAWYNDNSNAKTHPVKMKKSNGYGLYDMAGNVAEWCSDGYGNGEFYSSHDQTNPKGNTTSPNHIFRGGNWFSYNSGCIVYNRGMFNLNEQNKGLGFRIVVPE